ncbi:enoyl-CoA hydratase-related protein [Acinetobacter sp. Marseille-Q1618]|uniref:enoyl-CoA hydratase-related protein n=1 Tax=Acinetobacter sp. Marseille-Q1618 TaxID=2697502 RepID=UPI0015711B02|nr:enoyl-CoA hydratase-related protein [Acinetobacter sp. Marseille-Q1618]
MNYQNIKLEYHEQIAILTFNRPLLMNSLTVEMAQEVLDAFEQIRQNAEIHAFIITAQGKAFCSGAEINPSSFQNKNQTPAEYLNYHMQHHFNAWIEQLENFPIPVVVAMNGIAAGAGVGIALAGDITIAADEAYFILTFAPKLGLVPDMGTSWFLPHLIGTARSKAITLLGEKVSAQQAEQWGLIWKSVPKLELLDEALNIAKKLAKLPPKIAQHVRKTYAYANENNLLEQLNFEKDLQCQLIQTPAFFEGVIAFAERREPIFKG